MTTVSLRIILAFHDSMKKSLVCIPQKRAVRILWRFWKLLAEHLPPIVFVGIEFLASLGIHYIGNNSYADTFMASISPGSFFLPFLIIRRRILVRNILLNIKNWLQRLVTLL